MNNINFYIFSEKDLSNDTDKDVFILHDASCIIFDKEKETKTKVEKIIEDIWETIFFDTTMVFDVEFQHLHLLPRLSPTSIQIALNVV